MHRTESVKEVMPPRAQRMHPLIIDIDHLVMALMVLYCTWQSRAPNDSVVRGGQTDATR